MIPSTFALGSVCPLSKNKIGQASFKSTILRRSHACRWWIAPVAILTSLFSSCYAQTASVISLPARDPATLQSVEGGMWRLDGNFDSILHLKNVLLNQSLTVNPALIMSDGTSFPLTPIKLSPAGVALVNITDAMRHLPAG